MIRRFPHFQVHSGLLRLPDYAILNEWRYGRPIPRQKSLEELIVSTLAMTDALAKLMIAKGLITDEEFKAQLSTERANYLALLKGMQ